MIGRFRVSFCLQPVGIPLATAGAALAPARPPRVRPSTTLLCVFFAACTGSIVTPVPGPAIVDPNDPNDPNPQGPTCTAEDLAKPGRVTLRRLNRSEYDATVRDLLGDTSKPAKDFPADDFGRGFDNLGEVLSTSELLVEKWSVAAEKLTKAVLDAEMVAGQTTRVVGDAMTASTGSAAGAGAWNLFSNGTLSTQINFVTTGMFSFNVRAYQQAAGPDAARMRLSVDGAMVQEYDVAATAPASFNAQRNVTAGSHTVTVEFLNDYYMAPNDRNLIVEFVEVTRPGSVTQPANAKLLFCDPNSGDACVRDVLSKFARRAWRRPVAQAEVDKLFGLVTLARTNGDTVRVGLELAVQAVLLSPNFLYRPELGNTATVRSLSAHELATRLSYFLWSSMPDPQLDTLADDGTLAAQLGPQVTRMLQDPKASAFVQSFAGSWLWSRALADKQLVSDAMKSAQQEEVHRFFEAFVREDLSALDLLGANFTFVNDPLAALYGLPATGTGATLTRVTVDGKQRGTLLGLASPLTVTSHDSHTNPVKRGKWVLSQLLCAEPPPPPANVPAFTPDPTAMKSLREQMEAHRTNPVCAACHASMDPLGFGMENYDHLGKWRTTDEAGFMIDTTGKLPDGRTFTSPAELAGVLKGDAKFPRCLTEQLFIYGLGRDVTPADKCRLNAAAQSFKDSNYRLPALITTLVSSPSFTQREGEAP